MKSEKNVAEGAVVSKSALYKSLHNLALQDIGCRFARHFFEAKKTFSLITVFVGFDSIHIFWKDKEMI